MDTGEVDEHVFPLPASPLSEGVLRSSEFTRVRHQLGMCSLPLLYIDYNVVLCGVVGICLRNLDMQLNTTENVP